MDYVPPEEVLGATLRLRRPGADGAGAAAGARAAKQASTLGDEREAPTRALRSSSAALF